MCYVSADVIADGCPYDEESQCTIRLDDNSVVCLRAINRYLALVCQLPVQHYRYEGCIVCLLCDHDAVIPRNSNSKTDAAVSVHSKIGLTFVTGSHKMSLNSIFQIFIF